MRCGMADMEDGSAFVVTWRRGEQVLGVVSMVYDRERAAVEVSVGGKPCATLDVR